MSTSARRLDSHSALEGRASHDSHTRLAAWRDDRGDRRDRRDDRDADARRLEARAIVAAIWPSIAEDLAHGALSLDADAAVLVGEAFERRFPRLLLPQHFAVVPRYTAIAIGLVQSVAVGEALACAPSRRPCIDVLVELDDALILVRAKARSEHDHADKQAEDRVERDRITLVPA